MNLDGANVKSVATPIVKVQEWTLQMLPKFDKIDVQECDDANELHVHVGVQQAVKDVARFMKESNERAWIMLKCLVRYFMDHGRFVQVV